MPQRRGYEKALSTENLIEHVEDAVAQRIRGEQRAVMKALLTVLLAQELDDEAFTKHVDRLETLLVPMSRVQNCMLSRLCFHQALATVQGDQNWHDKLLPMWKLACHRLGTAEWAVNTAIATGDQFARDAKKTARGKAATPQALAQRVYDEFFNSDKVLEGL